MHNAHIEKAFAKIILGLNQNDTVFVHFVYQAKVDRAKGSTSLYYISLSLGFGNIDDRHRKLGTG